MKYQNRKNGVICELVRENKKFKTVTLRDEAGRERDYSSASLTKSWKRLDEEVPTEEKENKKENKLVPMPGADKLAELKEEYCADGTSYAEIGKEIAEQAKQKAKAVKKEKLAKATLEDRDRQLRTFLEACGYNVELKSGKMLKAKKDGCKTFDLYVGLKKAVLLFTKTNAPKDKKADRIANCPLSHRFDIDYNNLEILKEFM